ncbi:MAG TPA: MATE family efflux transporter [Ideonella sp.]|uniref:MATE family efflux transporter n=1 Tax=Ideonella sp. TaxID=1929293 RepID=UPI002E37C73E|nr:MATE family efflux transporter [Ideonella sp.]HEX5683754.1 MATE family efflux transporter [Ideonella sp.]
MSSIPASTTGSRGENFWTDVRRIAPLAWPVVIGQIAVLAFSTIDTVLVSRHSPDDLAAFAVGAAAYVTIFVGFMGIVLAVSPIAGQLFGAQRLEAAGDEAHQAVWLALALSVLGCLLLLFPQPFLWAAKASPQMADRVRGYLQALTFALPASMLFTVFRGFNTAVSRPKAVMALQIGGLVLKLPLSAALVFGVPALGVPELGVTGAGIATAVAMWAQVLLAALLMRRDPFYDQFKLWGRGLHEPNRKALWGLLRLGVPMGMAILVEVTGFSVMALLISRIGTLPVAGHQIAVNIVSLMFMLPLGLANATATLVAQRIGAGDLADARKLGWHGMLLGAMIAAALGSLMYLTREQVISLYTTDAAVAAAALPLLAWVVVFHLADALQTIAAFVLRAWRIATLPMFIYAGTLWGMGLFGGYTLGFDLFGGTPEVLQGARGFWAASTAGLVVAGIALTALMQLRLRPPPAR